VVEGNGPVAVACIAHQVSWSPGQLIAMRLTSWQNHLSLLSAVVLNETALPANYKPRGIGAREDD
jgi:hypothetical protein